MIIGSEKWLEWRKNHITATDAAVIMRLSPYNNPFNLWAEKLGLKDSPPLNFAMQRGNDLEPIARDRFEEEMGLLVFPSIVKHKTIPYLAATLDGINLERDVIVEIKANGPKSHAMALDGIVPKHHFCQIQHQLECVGIDLAYYYSFDGEKGVILEVKRDQLFIDNMLEKEFEFWQCLEAFIPPKRNIRATRGKNERSTSVI